MNSEQFDALKLVYVNSLHKPLGKFFFPVSQFQVIIKSSILSLDCILFGILYGNHFVVIASASSSNAKFTRIDLCWTEIFGRVMTKCRLPFLLGFDLLYVTVIFCFIDLEFLQC